MNASPRTIIGLASAVAAIAVAWSAAAAARARAEAKTAIAAFERTRADAAEVIALRAVRPMIAVSKRPEPGVYGQFTDAMVEAGAPVTALTSLTPDADGSVTVEGAGPCRRQSVRVTLEGLTLPQVGRVLSAWRHAQPDWTVTQAQLTPAQTKDSPAPGVTTYRALRVTLVMEATYLEQTGLNQAGLDQPGTTPP